MRLRFPGPADPTARAPGSSRSQDRSNSRVNPREPHVGGAARERTDSLRVMDWTARFAARFPPRFTPMFTPHVFEAWRIYGVVRGALGVPPAGACPGSDLSQRTLLPDPVRGSQLQYRFPGRVRSSDLAVALEASAGPPMCHAHDLDFVGGTGSTHGNGGPGLRHVQAHPLCPRLVMKLQCHARAILIPDGAESTVTPSDRGIRRLRRTGTRSQGTRSEKRKTHGNVQPTAGRHRSPLGTWGVASLLLGWRRRGSRDHDTAPRMELSPGGPLRRRSVRTGL